MVGGDFRFDIHGAPLDKALEVALLAHKKVVAWRVDEDPKRLVLFWVEHTSATPLPAPLTDPARIAGFIQSWLDDVDYGCEPDLDGSVGRGCRVYTEAWGHIDHLYQAFVAIEPHWLLYGK